MAKQEELIEVTQADRNRAADLLPRWANEMRGGEMDDHKLVQAFARHRLSALSTAKPLPGEAGVCAYDRDECTVTIALDNEAATMALVRSLTARNRCALADDAAPSLATPSVEPGERARELLAWLLAQASEQEMDWAADNQPVEQGGPGPSPSITPPRNFYLEVAQFIERALPIGDEVREALQAAERVFFFDLSAMREMGPNYNQAVVDAGNLVRAALAKQGDEG